MNEAPLERGGRQMRGSSAPGVGAAVCGLRPAAVCGLRFAGPAPPADVPAVYLRSSQCS